MLIDAPIGFGDDDDPIARTVALMPDARSFRLMFGSSAPGSAINLLSAATIPAIFIGQPATDRVARLAHAEAAAIHARHALDAG